MTTAHTATPLTDKQITEFADTHAVVIGNAYIGYTGVHMDHGAAYAIAEAMAPICACNAHDDLVKALKDLLERYTSLVASGDAGNWDAEAEPEVIAARSALAKAGAA